MNNILVGDLKHKFDKHIDPCHISWIGDPSAGLGRPTRCFKSAPQAQI